MKRVVSAAFVAMLTAFTVIGCHSTANSEERQHTRVMQQEMPDGRTVDCVGIIYGTNGAAITCNWDAYNEPRP